MIANYAEWSDNFASLAMDNPDKPNLAQYFASTIKAYPFNYAFTIICSIFQSDHRAELCKLHKPTLLIQAKQDFAVPLEVALYLHNNIKNSSLTIIEASGHLPHISTPELVVAAINDFIRFN